MGLLDDRIVLVDGGSQGAGAVIARAAVREGAVAAVSGRRAGPGGSLVSDRSGVVTGSVIDWDQNVLGGLDQGAPFGPGPAPASSGLLPPHRPHARTPARPHARTHARTHQGAHPMRIGILGLGRIGAFHAETLSGLDVVESLVVTDPSAGAAKAAAERFGAEVADSPGAVLAAGVDAVVVAAPTDTHPSLLLAGVEAGIPVFCEKPVARTMAEGTAVLKGVADSGVPVQIGFNRRFDAGFTAAREAVLSGALGKLHTVRSTTLDPAPPPAAYVASSGGIFRDCSVHDFDIIRWVTGREVTEVYAVGGNRGAEYIKEAGDADTTGAVLTLDDGAIAVVSNSRHNGRGYDVRMELHGFADSVAVGLEDKLPLRSVEPGTTFPAGTPHDFFMDRFTAAYRAELAAFTQVVAGTLPSPCTVADALEAGWIAEACTLSLREHRPVTLAEVRGA
jgi:myo-inositol 2-dehydrogenase / D-chiro-inositol 1-dehydrogenase